MTKLGMLFLLFMTLSAVAFPLTGIEPKTPVHNDSNANQAWLNSKNAEFMTSADRVSNTVSNVRIQNIGPTDTITTIYIYTLSSSPDDCTVNTVFESVAEPYGALWAPQVTLEHNEIKQVGANYLYNMISFFLYGANISQGTGDLTPGVNPWCFWLGITNQAVGTGSLTSSTGSIDTANQLVQFIPGTPPDPPVSFTNITCNDSTRLCSTSDTIAPQPFPHQQP